MIKTYTGGTWNCRSWANSVGKIPAMTGTGMLNKMQINTSGVHPAKREPQLRTGVLTHSNPTEKSKNGVEHWQTMNQSVFEDYGDIKNTKAVVPE